MPTHVYKPLRNPPSWWDRMMVHPMDTVVAAVAVMFGVLVALSLLTPLGFIPSKSMDKMPWAIVVLVSGFLGTGGLLALVGLNFSGDNVSKGWAIERLGWLLSSGGFVTYAITVSWHYPGSIFSWSVPLALGMASALRCLSIALIEKSTRRTIAEVKGGRGE
ncbi:hypothetical protein [Pseudarthrobacter sp. PS3-L1]|uniref:hypothetical protein n=1 Tax=Pseudarthrobacter sp. PS3-L1 TaxID=3046207 RepID=UPI0024BAFE29|nr:hypothetical protein [Pseudarthrobacter sp. PS3-L1]MDJ0321818.1 hypothetical protein [Pseudarthrobacter sp. PS3-L1]